MGSASDAATGGSREEMQGVVSTGDGSSGGVVAAMKQSQKQLQGVGGSGANTVPAAAAESLEDIMGMLLGGG